MMFRVDQDRLPRRVMGQVIRKSVEEENQEKELEYMEFI